MKIRIETVGGERDVAKNKEMCKEEKINREKYCKDLRNARRKGDRLNGEKENPQKGE